jgi:hypothetical protein
VKPAHCRVSHAIAIDSDGGAWTWGGNNYGQLGHGRDSVKQQQVEGSKRILCSTPRLVASLRTDAISGVACGDFHTLAVSHAGKIFAWGTGEILGFRDWWGTGGICRFPASQLRFWEAIRKEVVRPKRVAVASFQLCLYLSNPLNLALLHMPHSTRPSGK